MLSRPPRPRRAASGVALILALIVLAAMTLGGVALTRSVFTTHQIAGNLAFQQAATHSADEGVEAAIAWLENNSGQSTSSSATACASSVGSTVLACDQSASGYLASRQDPSPSQSWADFWRATLASKAITLSTDVAGNRVAYVIQRLCNGAGDASTSNLDCTQSPNANTGTCAGGSSCDSQRINLKSGGGSGQNGSQVYYRVTVQVSGPRGTQSLVQVVVAL
ncbi:hypothetical protein PSQ39_19745 [Curvibacter sp. HBC28]|uniref:Type 4 fimbrial biogenesis protein PilX N-terminal domain-containing protein n=1 Tax=Curvibacter microcysteis TaxID=3026419 RepID=A0ABT5MKF6_9BURK|nr:hypothetical protein [Curvibacter sp. HBC28]MDD0816876.1 hypothetical protein [Curvibacter sp. HBC28]